MIDKGPFWFTPKSEWGKDLRKWHGRLEENRGDRAALRKCASITDVVFVAAYHSLFQDISLHCKAAVDAGKIRWRWFNLEYRLAERLPIIAGLAAVIETDRGVSEETSSSRRSLAGQMGTERSSGGGPRVSDLRFRRLLKCQTPEDLYHALRRVIRLLDNKADLLRLANDVFRWNDEVRKRWAYDYYATPVQDTK
jgi:CRISPR system Cascade subunit CasB